MKLLVAVKRVVDANVKVRPSLDGKSVDLNGVKMGINPFDENAVEEAVRLKEAGIASEVVVVAAGGTAVQEVLRHALAMGADRAIFIDSPTQPQNLAWAKIIRAVVQKELPELVLLGKQAIDDDASEVAQMLASLLNWGQGTFASKLDIADGKIKVTREIDVGQEVVELKLPAVISADLRLNEPRYLKLPNLMMAKKKPLETININDLAQADAGVLRASALETISVSEPPKRKPGKKLNSVDELIQALRDEAKVI